jgi:hypothetical protein
MSNKTINIRGKELYYNVSDIDFANRIKQCSDALQVEFGQVQSKMASGAVEGLAYEEYQCLVRYVDGIWGEGTTASINGEIKDLSMFYELIDLMTKGKIEQDEEKNRMMSRISASKLNVAPFTAPQSPVMGPFNPTAMPNYKNDGYSSGGYMPPR